VTTLNAPRSERTLTSDLLAIARPVSLAASIGALVGVLVGGVGGRGAMFLLRLTSDASVRGLESDDGFTIGVVSSASLFLLFATALLGLLGGAAYLIVRRWLPSTGRPWLFGALCGLLGGAIVIRPGGVDFTRLEPRALAVALFVALPAAYGVVASLVVERRLPRGASVGAVRAAAGSAAVAFVIALTGVAGVAFAAVTAAAFLLWRSTPAAAAAWSSRPATWLGRAGLSALALAAGIALARDVSRVFS
jgi:hypothetical protein